MLFFFVQMHDEDFPSILKKLKYSKLIITFFIQIVMKDWAKSRGIHNYLWWFLVLKLINTTLYAAYINRIISTCPIYGPSFHPPALGNFLCRMCVLVLSNFLMNIFSINLSNFLSTSANFMPTQPPTTVISTANNMCNTVPYPVHGETLHTRWLWRY